ATSWAAISVPLAYVARRLLPGMVGFAIICADLYLGNREMFAATALGLAFTVLSVRPAMRASSQASWILFVTGMGFLLFVWKFLYVDVTTGRYQAAIEKLTSADFYVRTFGFAEPSIQQAILNEVLRENFEIPISH